MGPSGTITLEPCPRALVSVRSERGEDGGALEAQAEGLGEVLKGVVGCEELYPLL